MCRCSCPALRDLLSGLPAVAWHRAARNSGLPPQSAISSHAQAEQYLAQQHSLGERYRDHDKWQGLKACTCMLMLASIDCCWSRRSVLHYPRTDDTCALSPDKRFLATVCWDDVACLEVAQLTQDVTTSGCLPKSSPDLDMIVSLPQWRPDGSAVAVAYLGRHIEKGEPFCTFLLPPVPRRTSQQTRLAKIAA